MLTWNWLPFAELYLRLKLPERIYCQRRLVFLLSQSMQCTNFYSSLQLNYGYFENQNSLRIWVPILQYLASVLFFPALSRQFCYKCLMQTGDPEEKKKKKRHDLQHSFCYLNWNWIQDIELGTKSLYAVFSESRIYTRPLLKSRAACTKLLWNVILKKKQKLY